MHFMDTVASVLVVCEFVRFTCSLLRDVFYRTCCKMCYWICVYLRQLMVCVLLLTFELFMTWLARISLVNTAVPHIVSALSYSSSRLATL